MTREELEKQFPIGSFVQRNMGTHVEKLKVVGYDAPSNYWGESSPNEGCYLRIVHVDAVPQEKYGDEIYTFLTDNPQPYVGN